MSYDAICFDMDGVLLSGYHTDRSVYRQAAAATLADFGVEYDGEPPVGLADPDTVADVRSVCDELSIPATAAWAYRERAATTIENEGIVAGDRTVFPDTAALDSLSATVGIVSNNRQGTARFVAEHFSIPATVVRGRFPVLGEFGRLKPDPHLLTWAVDRLDTEDVLFVGDRRTDVEAAHRAGVDAALLSRDGDPPAGDPVPEYHIESLGEIPDLLGES